MAKHLNCKCCQKPIILVPSAEERAAKDTTGKTWKAEYWTHFYFDNQPGRLYSID